MKQKVVVSIKICLVLIIGIILFAIINNKPISIITLDINPSIKISLTKDQRIKNIIALNDDAKKIVSGDLKNLSLT